MGVFKEIWIEQYDKLYNKYIEAGFSEEEADKFASDHALDEAQDFVADYADAMHERWKEQQYANKK